jgi:CheY-like chemotaxis protein
MEQRKILVVDDDYSYVDFAKMLLEQMGFSVVTTLNADAALPLAVSEQPDLVLIDWAMDEMNGDEVIKILKKDPRTKAIPVILCSITRDPKSIAAAKNHGAEDFIPKPLDRDRLQAMLDKYLKIL